MTQQTPGTLAADFDRIALLSDEKIWNHNVHYHPFLLRHLPSRIESALDIGCGKGEFARLLASRADKITGIDLSSKMIETAKAQSTTYPNIHYVLTDVMAMDYSAESFDCIASIATLHHLPLDAVLKQIKGWLKPGGTLLILDLVQTEPRWLWQDTLSIPGDRIMQVLKNRHIKPTEESRQAWDQHGEHDRYPTFSEVKQICADLLPGATCTRHFFWRYSIMWTKP